jgi:EAL domain-containing protein (putative c-di-GMP-specific phosphodiesterase class I)
MSGATTMATPAPAEGGVSGLRNVVLGVPAAAGNLVISAQPIVCLGTGERSGIEVFAEYGGVRGAGWHAAPVELLDEVFALTLGCIDEIMRAAPDADTISVNVDPRSLRDVHAQAVIAAVAALEDRVLVLEILETGALDRQAVQTIEHFRSLGARCVIDDFGTGWAGIERLNEVTWDGVKLDRCWVDAAARGDSPAELAPAIAEHRFSYVVVEGVDSALKDDLARRCGASHAQGWFYDRPAVIC